MSPKGIVERTVADGLAIIAVTDHNEVSNGEIALAESKGRTLLVYFPELSDLKDFYGKLDFADRGTGNSRCQTAMLECLKLIDPLSPAAPPIPDHEHDDPDDE